MLTTFNELKVSVRITFLTIFRLLTEMNMRNWEKYPPVPSCKCFGKVRHIRSTASAFPRKIDMKWRDHVINDGLAHKWILILQRGEIRHSENCGCRCIAPSSHT